MLLYLLISVGLSHSGRTNSYGCHAGRKPYHCHSGYVSSVKVNRSYNYKLRLQEQERQHNELKEKHSQQLKEKQISLDEATSDNRII